MFFFVYMYLFESVRNEIYKCIHTNKNIYFLVYINIQVSICSRNKRFKEVCMDSLEQRRNALFLHISVYLYTYIQVNIHK